MERQARQTRPQLVCILADSSGSMAGKKAQAATEGILEMIMECQSRGPTGPDRSYFELLLITFDQEARVHPDCDCTPVREIDPDRIQLECSGGRTNITGALELTLERLTPYMQALQDHPEKDEHPLPLVILFSDGKHNVGESPQKAASSIKNLQLGSDHVVIACAAVAAENSQPDEATLLEIATPLCFARIEDLQDLTDFISSVGSSGSCRPEQIGKEIEKLDLVEATLEPEFPDDEDGPKELSYTE